MFKSFLRNNNRSILIISVLLGGWILLYVFNNNHKKNEEALNNEQIDRYLKQPKNGDIYIFHEDKYYAPMRLDSVGEETIYMRNYLYTFADAIPKKKQILDEEFDLAFFAIYEKNEIERLKEEGRLVKIYR